MIPAHPSSRYFSEGTAMAKTPRSKSSKKSLDEVHVNAAGLDVGATFHVAAVPSDRP